MIEYTYDGWDVIREDSSLKGVTVYQNGLGIDDKLRSKNGNVIRYFLTDHLGSTVALTDANGAITSSTTYDSFGNAAPKQATGSAASGQATGSAASGQAAGSAASGAGKAAPNIATSYRYTGREYDADTGLYYYRSRWYDPEVGRFISEDPIGFAGGDINLYGYVWNNPQSWTDPSGNYACGPQKDKSKLAPKGTASDRKLSQAECDKKFAKIFGGEGAMVGSVSDPLSLGKFDDRRKEGTLSAAHAVRARGHGPALFDPPDPKNYDRGGIIHVYGDARGNTYGKPLYAPAGGRVGRLHMQGSNEVRRVSYSTGLTISFFHVAYSKEKDVNSIGSRRIGNIGGGGGDGLGYIHSHLIFYSDFRKRERVDPREVFCGW